MNRTICHCKYTASWIFCALIAGLSQYGLAQTLPPLMPVHVQNFTIPFEIGESATTIREVELLVSKDRGRRWYSVAKQPVETKKFTFLADSDGEYWFSFRTATATGNISPMSGVPQLRVLVNTRSPMVVLPPQPSGSGPLTPPKPTRFRDTNAPKPNQPISTHKLPESEPDKPVQTSSNPSAPLMLGPKLPGLELPDARQNRDADLLEDLLSEMSPFLDVQPVVTKSVPGNPAAVEKSNPVPESSHAEIPAGSISGIFLNKTETSPQIVVRWNTGREPWRDAQIDILRSSTKEGQPTPIAINLPNNGEYWWFLTPEDLKPFHIVVRIRSLYGGICTDITQTAITIDPKIAHVQSHIREIEK